MSTAALLALLLGGIPGAGAETSSIAEPIFIEADLPGTGGVDLQVYGYADFSLVAYLLSSGNRWRNFIETSPTFAVGSFNVYLDSHLSDRWRSLGEVRFLYFPNGKDTYRNTGQIERTDTSVDDYTDFNLTSNLRWAGIAIERLWLEFEVDRLLRIRAGSWLTPYGIWNVDHGSPTLIGVQRPFVISEDLFPQRQTGVEIYGVWPLPLGAVDLGYHLTLSNGRGPIQSYRDLDSNKAVGGRLYVHLSGPGDLTVGASAYYGRYTDVERTFDAPSAARTGIPTVDTEVADQYDELSLAGDLRWEWDPVVLNFEIVSNQRRYTDEGRPPVNGYGTTALRPDYTRWGTYAVLGYRTDVLGIIPHIGVEYYEFGALATVPKLIALYGGVNARVLPEVVLKAFIFHASFPDAGPDSIGRDALKGLQLQLAWAF